MEYLMVEVLHKPSKEKGDFIQNPADDKREIGTIEACFVSNGNLGTWYLKEDLKEKNLKFNKK